MARQLRTVFRGCGPLGAAGVVLHAGPDGLRARAQYFGGVALEYHLPVTLPTDSIRLPAAALDDFRGGDESVVVLQWGGPDTVEARWEGEDGPHVACYTVAHPDVPRTDAPLPPLADPGSGFSAALQEATRTSAAVSGRLALSHLQLRGSRGQVLGTDGNALFIQSGFVFPWDGDRLIPALRIFVSRELLREAPVAVGVGEAGVVLRFGHWTFHFSPDASLRFPDVDAVLPKPPFATFLRLSSEDAATLVGAMRPVRAGSDESAKVWLVLRAEPVVLLEGEWLSRPGEIVLAQSEVIGTPMRIASNPQYLRRALELGFTEFRLSGADRPILCRDKRCTYLWMPLF